MILTDLLGDMFPSSSENDCVDSSGSYAVFSSELIEKVLAGSVLSTDFSYLFFSEFGFVVFGPKEEVQSVLTGIPAIFLLSSPVQVFSTIISTFVVAVKCIVFLRWACAMKCHCNDSMNRKSTDFPLTTKGDSEIPERPWNLFENSSLNWLYPTPPLSNIAGNRSNSSKITGFVKAFVSRYFSPLFNGGV